MKIIIAFIILYLLTGCSSSSKKAQRKIQNVDDVETIENIDFKVKKQIPFSADEDYFKHKDLKSSDIFFDESIYRLQNADLTQLNDDEDPVTRVISLCYQRKFHEAYKIAENFYIELKAHPSYWNQIGTCYFLEGNNQKARLFYNKSLEINKNYTPALNNLGVLYLQENKDQKAFLAFKMAKENNSFSLTPLFNMAQLYIKYSFLKEGCEIFNILHSRDKSDYDVIAGLASCQLFKNRVSESVMLFSRLPDSYLKRSDVVLNYAVALKLMKKDDEAKKILSNIKENELVSGKEYYAKVAKFIEDKI